MSTRRLYFVSAEASGDQLAAETMASMRDLDPALDLIAASSRSQVPEIAEPAGIDLSDISILGWWDGIKALPRIQERARLVASDIIARQIDDAVLTDSWGFSLRVARHVKSEAPAIRCHKLVGPQVWASRPGRAKTVAALYDHVLCLLPTELDFYKRFNIRATLIGPPALNPSSEGSGDKFRHRYGLDPSDPICLICPGSRPSEIERVAPDLITAGRMLQRRFPGLRCVIAPQSGVSDLLRSKLPPQAGEVWIDTAADLRDAMASATLALACSGTITTELAVAGVPTLVGYRVSGFTYRIAKSGLMTAPYISLLNNAAGEEVLPEFLQGSLSPERLAQRVEVWMSSDIARSGQILRQSQALEQLRQTKKPASEIAARAILDFGQ